MEEHLPYTIKQLWNNDERINRVTFRHVLSMTSGVKDYYSSPAENDFLIKTQLETTRDVTPLEFLRHG